MAPRVLWFRRDLRLGDNPALLSAADGAGDPGDDSADGEVLGLFVLDDRLRGPSGANRLAFLHRSLRALDGSMGGRLVVRTGDPAVVVPAVAAEVGAHSVFLAADFGPYGSSRDTAVEQALAAAGRTLVRVGSPYVAAPGTVVKGDGSAFRVFTPFYRAWKGGRHRAAVDAPVGVQWIGAPSDGVPADPLTTAELPPAGERAALERLAAFAGRVGDYADDRNTPGADGTSRLSVYLKYGCIHPRQLLDGLGRSEAAERFRTEVAWREFYADVLFHHPETVRESLQPAMRAMRHDEGPEADERFAAWTEGRTGYPIVDAGMRQLKTEGWMHNRVRMITASFLVKDLHLDWRRGARWFFDQLVDGDLASNYHGWQWVAGTGTDPAPYFRIFNPVVQGEKFDPAGEYVRRFVPELAGLGDRVIHHPWDASGGVPAGYPQPVVDHATGRRESLSRYEAVRASQGEAGDRSGPSPDRVGSR